MSNRIEELEKQLAQERAKLQKEIDKSIFQETGFKKGDIVEFIVSEMQDADGYLYKDIWYSREIYNLSLVRGNVYANMKGFHGSLNVTTSNMKHFEESDDALRHSVWNRELELGDKIQLIVDKPKSTKYKIYEVFKIVKQVGENNEYWYYNDYGHPTTLLKGDYFLTHE